MEDVIEIVKIVVPALIVFVAVYMILKQFFDREQSIRKDELKLKETKEYTPLKIQAYERTVLYMERIDPNNMIIRLHKPGMSARLLHSEMLKVIREEYVHNMTQQIYISIKAWDGVKTAKEETSKIINMAMHNLKDTATGIDLSSKIFGIVSKLEKTPTEMAVTVLKRDFQKGMQ